MVFGWFGGGGLMAKFEFVKPKFLKWTLHVHMYGFQINNTLKETVHNESAHQLSWYYEPRYEQLWSDDIGVAK